MDELTCPNCDGPLLKEMGSKGGERLEIIPKMRKEWIHPCGAKIKAEFDWTRKLEYASVSFPSMTSMTYVDGKFVRDENGS